MKILFVNPNITPEITTVMSGEAIRQAAPGTEIVPVTARFGTLYIANRIEAAIAAHAVLDIAAENATGMDGMVVSAFGDPGVLALRELLDIPVVGVSEAAFHFAYLLGRRYAMVCLTERLRDWYVECAEEHGLAGRLTQARAIPKPPTDIRAARAEVAEAVLAECLRCVEEDRAEVIIVAGGPAAGLARELASRVPVPLLDGVTCGVRMIEALVRLAPAKAQRGSFAKPAPKPSQSLSPALAALIEGRTR